MATSSLPTPEQLRQLFSYDPNTGSLTWLVRNPSQFANGNRSAEHRANNWNATYAGKIAGCMSKIGYRYVVLPNRKIVPEHRVILAMCEDIWPEYVDHIDGNRGNNRRSNLRNVSKVENCRNIALPSDNTSGHIGVSWDKRYNLWQVGIGYKGKRISLGRYADLADAIKARKRAELKYGFHANHGRVGPVTGG